MSKKRTISKEKILMEEIKKLPDPLFKEVFDFIQFLKNKFSEEKMGITLLSESSLKKDWLIPEEDKVWADL